MFDQIKPGHVLRFGTDPATIISPHATNAGNDNTLLTPWPTTSHLGMVQCISHPSGPIGAVAAAVATGLRDGKNKSRSASYSGIGRLVTASNRVVGSVNCDFVGYVDGQTNYIQSALTTFSKDFSGCLMVEYNLGGHRNVAHVAASQVPAMNCKQAFLTALHGQHGILNHGWFRPFVFAESGRKADAYGAIKNYIGKIDDLTTFGVVTAAGVPYSIDAFKPKGVAGKDWIVTFIEQKTMSQSWVAP
ncbi:MAG TPA: hypothetical protein VGN16_07380 [Acidobacteriaceae bacterium]|jgi:hypothetical protein